MKKFLNKINLDRLEYVNFIIIGLLTTQTIFNLINPHGISVREGLFRALMGYFLAFIFLIGDIMTKKLLKMTQSVKNQASDLLDESQNLINKQNQVIQVQGVRLAELELRMKSQPQKPSVTTEPKLKEYLDSTLTTK